jgi:mannose-6-phosphate isomerase-like protein (cupin superfamily)
MDKRIQSCFGAVLLCSLTMSGSSYAEEKQGAAQAVERNMADMKLGPLPGLPACAQGAVQKGDPSKEPSFIFGKLSAGCTIPWHWHTPNEHLVMVSGEARIEMKDGKPFDLRPGGFALLPSRHLHQFSCVKSCALYVYSDTAFDIHYVDKQGKEIPQAEALRAKAAQ